MNKKLLLTALTVVAASLAVAQFPRPGARTSSATSVVVDSVMYRSDVCRVYARLVGIPHTSECVTSATLTAGKITLTATDIDPIYFTRNFQWEDEPDMPVEIDFPPLKSRPGSFTLTVVTPRKKIIAPYPRKTK